MAKKKNKEAEIRVPLKDVSCFNIKQVLYVPDVGGDFAGYSMILFKDATKLNETIETILKQYVDEIE